MEALDRHDRPGAEGVRPHDRRGRGPGSQCLPVSLLHPGWHAPCRSAILERVTDQGKASEWHRCFRYFRAGRQGQHSDTSVSLRPKISINLARPDVRPLFCKSFAEFVHGTARAALEHCTARQRGSRCDTGVAFAAGHEEEGMQMAESKPAGVPVVPRDAIQATFEQVVSLHNAVGSGGAADIVPPGKAAVIHLIEADIAGRVVAEQDVVGAVAEIIADRRHRIGRG